MPSVTAVLTRLKQEDFEAVLGPNSDDPGGPAHFRDRFVDFAKTQPIFYRDPIQDVDTGQTARQIIQAQANQHGWPLLGLYISGSGGTVPHFAVHISDFPNVGGPPDQRPDNLQTELDAALELIYKTTQTIDDPEDPDFGQTVDVRNFWVVTHVWNYPATTPREIGAGDYVMSVSDKNPPGNWWQGL